MAVSPADKNIAIIVANGFDENHITEIQRALTRAKIAYKIIAPEQGLVNGWQGEGWGHYFTVDAPLGSALGSDYDALVLVGGERAIAKLKLNPHTRRIVNHFLEAGKPVSAIADGVLLLALSPKSAGLPVAASAALSAELTAAGLTAGSNALQPGHAVLTADGSDIAAWAEATLALFNAMAMPEQVAA